MFLFANVPAAPTEFSVTVSVPTTPTSVALPVLRLATVFPS